LSGTKEGGGIDEAAPLDAADDRFAVASSFAALLVS